MITILAIGNSFSQDATHYLHQIAAADADKEIALAEKDKEIRVLNYVKKYTPEGGSILSFVEEIQFDKPGWTMMRFVVQVNGF